MRDARALRTLALLDLESHPPDAAIDRVTVAVDPTPGRVVQFSLLTRPLPPPEQLSTLAARLAALMGEGRCGSPELVDSWRPGACAMKPFNPEAGMGDRGTGIGPNTKSKKHSSNNEPPDPRSPIPDPGSPIPEPGSPIPDPRSRMPTTALRRFRMPIPARVHVEDGRPVRVSIDRRGYGGGQVEIAAGPWRTSGAWWEEPASVRRSLGEGGWDRDEWDVELAAGVTYRLYRERRADSSTWFVEGIVD